ncbi:MAG: Ku protein [Halofilum sp. (in: g-proteobacteria)]
MPRAVWKGSISFGLVNVPITLFPAEERSELHFRMLDRRDHARVRFSRVNEATGEEIPWNEIVRGFEYEDGQYVLLAPEDFEQVAVEATKTIDIEQFVAAKEVDYVYFDKPYYLVPGKGGEKGYVLLRESLRRSGKMGIARVVIRTRQYIAGLIPEGDALLLDLMRYHEELRSTEQFDLPHKPMAEYRISDREIRMAEQLIDSMTDAWEPSAYKDEYRERLQAYIEEKARSPKGKKRTARADQAGAGGAQVVDMMELLKRSVDERGDGQGRSGGSGRSRGGGRKRTG